MQLTKFPVFLFVVLLVPCALHSKSSRECSRQTTLFFGWKKCSLCSPTQKCSVLNDLQRDFWGFLGLEPIFSIFMWRFLNFWIPLQICFNLTYNMMGICEFWNFDFCAPRAHSKYHQTDKISEFSLKNALIWHITWYISVIFENWLFVLREPRSPWVKITNFSKYRQYGCQNSRNNLENSNSSFKMLQEALIPSSNKKLEKKIF